MINEQYEWQEFWLNDINGEPIYVGTIPERQDIPVGKKVEPVEGCPRALEGALTIAERERDMWRSECASISEEFNLPAGIRPSEGEISRFIKDCEKARGERDDALRERRGAQRARRSDAGLVGCSPVELPAEGWPPRARPRGGVRGAALDGRGSEGGPGTG